MINLLPLKQKAQLELEDRWKNILILGFLIFSFLICLSLIMALVNISIANQKENQKPFIETKRMQVENPSNHQLREELAEFNSILVSLNSLYEKPFNLTAIIEKVDSLVPSGTYLTNIDFGLITASKSEYEAYVSLSGFSPSREDLYELKANMEQEFLGVNFPASNWLKPVNIDFKADFKLNL